MTPPAGATVIDRIWRDHVVCRLDDGPDLLHVDRHLVHEMTSWRAFDGLRRRGIRVHSPELTFAVVDHIVATAPGRKDDTNPAGLPFIQMCGATARSSASPISTSTTAARVSSMSIGPELGIALPGCDAGVRRQPHRRATAALGALAWGIGTSEVEHVLATQTIVQRRPQPMRLRFAGRLAPGVAAKDLILYVIGRLGTSAARGHMVEYAGPAIEACSIDQRLTICNMSIELGARAGPGRARRDHLRVSGRSRVRPAGPWDEARALAHPAQRRRRHFRCRYRVRLRRVAAADHLGHQPAGRDQRSTSRSRTRQRSQIRGTARRWSGRSPTSASSLARCWPAQPIDYAFIGSCTNGRLSDLEAAAAIARGRRVASGVRALVVPGSTQVRDAAVAAGLDRVFIEAGFEWRNAGCSMCVAGNGDVVPPQMRCIATSNRNFEGRQGPGSRTHLASPASVAAAAVSGRIVDVRTLAAG